MKKSAYAWAASGALGVGACVLGVATLLNHEPADAIPRPAVTVGPSTTGSPEPSRPTPSLSPSAGVFPKKWRRSLCREFVDVSES